MYPTRTTSTTGTFHLRPTPPDRTATPTSAAAPNRTEALQPTAAPSTAATPERAEATSEWADAMPERAEAAPSAPGPRATEWAATGPAEGAPPLAGPHAAERPATEPGGAESAATGQSASERARAGWAVAGESVAASAQGESVATGQFASASAQGEWATTGQSVSERARAEGVVTGEPVAASAQGEWAVTGSSASAPPPGEWVAAAQSESAAGLAEWAATGQSACAPSQAELAATGQSAAERARDEWAVTARTAAAPTATGWAEPTGWVVAQDQARPEPAPVAVAETPPGGTEDRDIDGPGMDWPVVAGAAGRGPAGAPHGPAARAAEAARGDVPAARAQALDIPHPQDEQAHAGAATPRLRGLDGEAARPHPQDDLWPATPLAARGASLAAAGLVADAETGRRSGLFSDGTYAPPSTADLPGSTGRAAEPAEAEAGSAPPYGVPGPAQEAGYTVPAAVRGLPGPADAEPAHGVAGFVSERGVPGPSPDAEHAFSGAAARQAGADVAPHAPAGGRELTWSVPTPGGAVPASGGAVPASGGAVPASGGAVLAPGGAVPAPGGAVPASGAAVPAPGGATPTPGGAVPASEGGVGWAGAASGEPAAYADADVEDAPEPHAPFVPGPGVVEVVARAVARMAEDDTQDLPRVTPVRGPGVTEVPVHLPFRGAVQRTAQPPAKQQPQAKAKAPAAPARSAPGRRVPRGDDRLREHHGPVLPGWIGVAVGGIALAGCAVVLWRAGAVPDPLAVAFGVEPRPYRGLQARFWPPLAFLGIIVLLALGGLGRGRAGHAWVLTLFGRYRGTVRRSGLTWISPLLLRRRVDVRLRHWRSDPMPAVDSGGLALQVVVQVVWQVKDTARATLAVADHVDYLAEQVESAMARVLSQLPADAFHEDAPTLRDAEAVGDALTRMLAAETEAVGVEVFSAQPTRIEYAPEVADAMRRRRVAAIDAKHRDTVLTSVVDAVDDTVHRLTSRGLVELDDYERKALVKDLTVAFYTGRAE